MPGRHHILRSPIFTVEAWDQHVGPLIDQLDGRAGGCVAVILEVDPMSQNFVRPSFGVFHDAERKIIRRAIQKSREKAREAQSKP